MKDSDGCILEVQIHKVLGRYSQLVKRCQYLRQGFKIYTFLSHPRGQKVPQNLYDLLGMRKSLVLDLFFYANIFIYLSGQSLMICQI